MSSGPIANQVTRLAHLDLPGGGQVVVDGDYAYVGHMKPPHGTTIINIADPRKPRVVATLELPDHYSHTHKVRVVGDLMVTNVEQNQRHFLRKAERLPALRQAFFGQHGRPPNAAELAKQLGVTPDDIAVLDTARARGYGDGGFKIYDIADKTRPRLLCHQKTFGFGSHRFDLDQNYAYISTEMEGFLGNILVIYDIQDPSAPRETARWWLSGQHLAGGETPTWDGYKNRLHHALRVGNELWAAVWYAGFRVIDLSDIAHPKTVAAHDYHPPFPEPTHTVLPLPQPVGGRRIAVAVDEEHDHTPGRLHAFMWVFDVSDYSNIHALSAFDVSEMDSPWSRCRRPGRFGAHQFRERFEPGDTLVYVTWFAGGLRIIDVADPLRPREVGSFIPEPVGDQPSPQSNDVDLDRRGLIYLIDRNRGFDILEFNG